MSQNPGTCPRCRATYRRSDFAVDGLGRVTLAYHVCERPKKSSKKTAGSYRSPLMDGVTVPLMSRHVTPRRSRPRKERGVVPRRCERCSRFAGTGEARFCGVCRRQVAIENGRRSRRPTPEPIADILPRVLADLCLRCGERQAVGDDDFCAPCRVELEREVEEMAGELP